MGKGREKYLYIQCNAFLKKLRMIIHIMYSSVTLEAFFNELALAYLVRYTSDIRAINKSASCY